MLHTSQNKSNFSFNKSFQLDNILQTCTNTIFENLDIDTLTNTYTVPDTQPSTSTITTHEHAPSTATIAPITSTFQPPIITNASNQQTTPGDFNLFDSKWGEVTNGSVN